MLKKRFKKKLFGKKKLFLKSRSMYLLFQQEILGNADNNIGTQFVSQNLVLLVLGQTKCLAEFATFFVKSEII